MPPSRSPGHVPRARHARRAPARRARRLVALTALALVALVTALLTAFASGGSGLVPAAAPSPAERLLPAGPPQPQIVAVQGDLRLQLPIAQDRVTAIGYHAAGDGAIALKPLGRQANEGLFARVVHRIFGGGGGGLRYYQLSGGQGPSSAALDVGAALGTDVYAPVDGVVSTITREVLNGRGHGVRIDIQPSGAPSIVVSVSRLRPDPALSVGSSIAAGTSKIGTVLDFSSLERQALARYTQDAGNHVTIEVHPAATLSLP